MIFGKIQRSVASFVAQPNALRQLVAGCTMFSVLGLSSMGLQILFVSFVHDAQPWLTQPSRYLYSAVAVVCSGALAWAAASAIAALQARECEFMYTCLTRARAHTHTHTQEVDEFSFSSDCLKRAAVCFVLTNVFFFFTDDHARRVAVASALVAWGTMLSSMTTVLAWTSSRLSPDTAYVSFSIYVCVHMHYALFIMHACVCVFVCVCCVLCTCVCVSECVCVIE